MSTHRIQTHGTRSLPNCLSNRALGRFLETPLPHPPGYVVKCAVDSPESSLAGYSPRYSVRYPESYLGGYPASYWADYSPENPASDREVCLDRNSAGNSAGCPDNRPEGNPERNLRSNGAGSPVNSLPGFPGLPSGVLPFLRGFPMLGSAGHSCFVIPSLPGQWRSVIGCSSCWLSPRRSPFGRLRAGSATGGISPERLLNSIPVHAWFRRWQTGRGGSKTRPCDRWFGLALDRRLLRCAEALGRRHRTTTTGTVPAPVVET